MPWTQVGPTDVHYEDRGSGQPLVFIHGALSSAETWYRQIDYFRDRYRVLAYDTVNHGLSSNSPRGEPEPDPAAVASPDLNECVDVMLAALRPGHAGPLQVARSQARIPLAPRGRPVVRVPSVSWTRQAVY